MPKIEHAGHWIEVTPFVEEAIDWFGLFRPEAVPYLADGVKTFMYQGNVGYELRRDGEELTDEEKRANGLAPRTRMSRAFWNALSNKGRAEPIRAPEVFFNRITSNLYREGKHRQMDESYWRFNRGGVPGFWDEVVFRVIEDRCCVAAARLNGSIIRTPNRSRLPLANCDRDVCHCRYDTREARRMRREAQLVISELDSTEDIPSAPDLRPTDASTGRSKSASMNPALRGFMLMSIIVGASYFIRAFFD